ncbi:site-specific integrase [Thiotrichales bacterium 19S3-7]|nr:site-specific integrase [Thiotrichales bacterium 19S3-7]MCF6801853.1 site-specific integrase [Thiotrichales bacterium 19S3-11]
MKQDNVTMSKKIPLALFDTMENIEQIRNDLKPSLYNGFNQADFEHAYSFLKNYTGSRGTYNSYRREIERLLHWCWLIADKSLPELQQEDIEAFIEFCKAPPENWISTKKAPRFANVSGERLPNTQWRPFVVTVSKSAYRRGQRPNVDKFELSQGAVKELFAILSSFYNYLLQKHYVFSNPITLIRQKSKFLVNTQATTKVRKLSDLQWQYVIKTANDLAFENPTIHERSYFVMSALYSMYLRISELVATSRWTPTMNDFQRDDDGNWWFITLGKGNKTRQIAVSDAMLDALKRWRRYLGLPGLPTVNDTTPLIPKLRGRGPVTTTTHIRRIVQHCFDQASVALAKDGFNDESDSLLEATVHWLRHTGISNDIKHRPRDHVRDDAGHSNSALTDRYVNIELRERHSSAKNKVILEEA